MFHLRKMTDLTYSTVLVVENRSSFVVSLSAATVWLAGRSEPFLEVEDIREDIPPKDFGTQSKRGLKQLINQISPMKLIIRFCLG